MTILLHILLLNLPVKKISKLLNIWRSYGQYYSGVLFFDSQCIFGRAAITLGIGPHSSFFLGHFEFNDRSPVAAHHRFLKTGHSVTSSLFHVHLQGDLTQTPNPPSPFQKHGLAVDQSAPRCYPFIRWSQHCRLGHLTRIKPIPDMTHNVFSGTLNPTQSIISTTSITVFYRTRVYPMH